MLFGRERRGSFAGLLALAVMSSALAPAAVVHAYDLEPPSGPATEAELEQARVLFVEGTGFVEAGRWADALARFEEAYRLSGVPAALFNAATTLRSMGRHRDARDAFAAFLERHGDLDPATARQARERQAEEARRVAVIELAGLGDHPDARIYLDDREAGTGGAPVVRLEADPGDHAVRVDDEGFAAWRRALSLEDGARHRLEVSLEPMPAGGEVHESGWFWVVFGLVTAAVIGGAVTAGVILQDAAQLQPSSGFDEHVIRL